MQITFIVLAALVIFMLFVLQRANAAKQDRITALLKENKWLRGVVSNKAKEIVGLYDDLLISEKAMQSAEKENECLKENNKHLISQLTVKTQLLEQLERGARNG